MEDVSDPPFRYICKLFGADITYTEFISSEGLIREASKSVKKLEFTEFERPIGIQYSVTTSNRWCRLPGLQKKQS